MPRCGLCGQPGKRMKLDNVYRILCNHHYDQHMARDGEHKVLFQKASGIERGNHKDNIPL